MKQPKKKRPVWLRLIRIVVKTVLFLILFFLLIVVLVLTPPVQNFLRKKAVTYLENKLHTRVEVGRIYIGLPKKVVLEDIYIEDRQKDTLLAGGLVKVDIALFKLISGDVDIRSVTLEHITAKIKRQLPDTTFNFQFIIDAFATPSTTPKDTTASSGTFSIGSIVMDQSRLVYKDVVTGNDIEAWINHFDTKVDRMDLAAMSYDIARIHVNGMVARVYQAKPLLSPGQTAVKTPQTGKAVTPQLTIGELDLKKINLDYRNDVSALYTTADIGSLLADPEKIDLSEQVMQFEKIALQNTTATVRIGRKEAAREMVEDIKQTADSAIEKGWRLLIGSFVSDNNNLQFDNDNLPRQRSGMDYAHMKVTPLNLEASDFLFSDDSVTARINKANFREQSGFELQELTTDFLYSGNRAYLHNLYLKTPGTELKRSVEIRYASPEALASDIGNLQIDLDIDNSKLLVKDVLTFVPSLRNQPAFANPNTTWYINSRVTGRVSDLNIGVLQVRGLQDTRIDISGRLTGLPDINRFSADLAIRNITSSRRDINLFLPPGTLPQQVTLPSRLAVSGSLKGNTRDMAAQLNARTDLGNAIIKGNIRQLNNPRLAQYKADVQAQGIDFGTILQDPQNLGPVTATFNVQGSGLDIKTANATIKGTVQSAVFKQYTYRNLDLAATLANGQATANAFIRDPNIHVALNATADLSQQYPAVRLDAMIDSLKTGPLNLGAAGIYRGKIEADLASTNPDDLVGTIRLTQVLMVQNVQRLQLDTVNIVAARTDSGHSIRLTSDVVHADLAGQYKLTQLGGIFQQAIQPYFSVTPAGQAPAADPYDFTFNAWVVNSKPLQAFVPDLKRMDSLYLQSHFANAGWNAKLNAAAIDYGTNLIRGVSVNAGTGQNAIQADVLVRQITSGSMMLYNTTVKATLANNTIDFTADVKDRAGKSRYNLAALFRQPQPGQYSFSFKPGGLLLNYEQWTVPNDNQILITPNDVIASNFVLSKSGQQLRINSLTQSAGAPLQVQFSNFRIATITAFVQNDSTLVDGVVNGSVTFTDILKDPIFKGDLNVTDLRVKNDTVGNAVIRVNNTTPDTYEADVVLAGRGNDLRLNGKYFMRPGGNSSFDMDLNIVQLPLTTAQAFSGGAIRSATGNVNGRFAITGTLNAPVVKGSLNFAQAGFNLAMLNSYFRIDNEKIEVNEQGIRFNRFEIRDSANNALVLNGTAATRNFRNYNFDFTVRANNFQALNSTKQDNNLFYGKLFFNTNLTVRGTEQQPVVQGSLVVNEGTKMAVVLPQREPGIVQREGVIEFVDMDAPLNDSLFLAAYDSLNTTPFTGMDVSATIQVSKEAEFSLVIDEGNGDFLNVKGEAALVAGIDPSGKMTLSGSYEIDEGSYELSFNTIRRKFSIDKGSRIVWLGEPTDAEVDVRAIYVANTAPLDLVKNELGNDISAAQRNTYLQKIPFEVLLQMQGKLLQPQISFDIRLPEDKSYRVSNDILTNVRNKLELMRQETGEMNKQVFALLLLNRFIGDNPFNSSSEGTTAGTMVRQSVSKLLTEQLNRLADDLIEGVDLNFDIASSEDYTTGERRDRTDLNVGLSKQLLNDRLTVSVGSNFELEGPQTSQNANNIAGNVALNYRLSKDGRYLLRAYRKNEYEGIIDGYIIETGVSFIISVDYNRFRDIFLSREERQKRREVRRGNREQRKEDVNADTQLQPPPQP
ncbi:MAG: translocation/assembly module TamB domain-containing protein [Chitinophagaceae bacterium]